MMQRYSVTGPWLDVVAVWAAAAGAAGAYVPEQIEVVLREFPEMPLDDVVRRALVLASEEAGPDAYVLPRGCEVRYELRPGGEGVEACAILWVTSVVTTLYSPRRGVDGGLVGSADLPDHVTRLDAARARAALRGIEVVDRGMW